MNHLIWNGLAYAPICAAIYIIVVNLDHFMKYGKAKTYIITTLNALFWASGFFGCVLLFLGCMRMAQNAS